MSISDQLAKAVVKGIQEQMNICPHHDVTVIVDGTEFECHRFLLSASSDFFRALFQSGMMEDLDNKVVLSNMSSAVFKLIIDSIYFAKGILTADNVSSVWHAANQLQIGYLFEACEIFQSKRLSMENCVNIRNDSKLLSSKKLQDLSWDVIIKEFDHLRKGDDIWFLDFDDMKCLVGDDNLTIPSEDVVIETIMRWVRFNPNEYILEDLKDGKEFNKTAQRERTDAENSISIDQVKEDPKDFKGPCKNKKRNSDKALRNKRRADCKQTLANVNSTERREDIISDAKNSISVDQLKENPKNSKDTSKNKHKLLKNKHGSDCKQILANFDLTERREDAVSFRREFLSELLAASKLLLVSGACLLNLLENKLVLEDPKSFALVREGLRYNLQLGSRQNYCPLYGKYRNTSVLQNVIFTISGSNRMKYSCRTLDGKWYLLACAVAAKCRAVTYGNDIYWTAATGSEQLAYKYDTSINTWTSIALLNVPRQDHALVCLDNYIYAIGGINCTSIERFDVEAEQKVSGSGRWENFGNLVKPMTNLMATTCNNMIVIFGSESEDSPSTFVQCFNTQSISTNIYMDNMSGTARNMVSFKHGEDTFVLQENGALWKVNLDSRLHLNIEFRTMLWAEPFTLMGAVVTNQELLVFGEGIDPQMPIEWDVCSFEHFKRIKIIERQGYCFLNTVIPKTFLVIPDS